MHIQGYFKQGVGALTLAILMEFVAGENLCMYHCIFSTRLVISIPIYI